MTEYTRITSSPEPDPDKKNSRQTVIILGGCLFVLLCFGCLALLGVGGGFYAWSQYQTEWSANGAATEAAWESRNTTIAEAINTPTYVPTLTSTPEATAGALATVPATAVSTEAAALTAVLSPLADVPADISQEVIPARAFTDLEQLYITTFPARDYYDEAIRLGDYGGPRTVTAVPYNIGDTRTFFNDTEEVEATLTAVTEHTYFWVETGLDLPPADVAEAANRFEAEYYDRLVSLFGQMWQPGVDNDPRFTVLHVASSAGDELGFFDSKDEYPADLIPKSNEQEMIYLNMAELEMGEDLYYATLVHEVQHLIQWYVDPSETAWMNEGLSQLAEIYLGYTDTADTVDYLDSPSTRLNDWEYEEDAVYAHYAGAYLFLVYVWEQLGETAVQELARHPADSMAAVYAILQGYAPDVTLEQFTANWAAANYLDNADIDEATADARFFYHNLDLRRPTDQGKAEPDSALTVAESLGQFGVHYINLDDLRGPTTITFAGDTAVPLIDAPLGENVFWLAPAVDEMDAQLTAVYDLTTADQASLTYAVWYDLEDDFDFAYVSISTDEGQTWELLQPKHDSRGDFGAGYNGRSAAENDSIAGWLKESINLDAYVGHNIHIRFDVLTDSGIAGQGFAVDNVAMSGYPPATFENGPEGWQAEGFVLTAGLLPQKWSLFLIQKGKEATVTPLPLNALNQGEWSIEIGKTGGILMIMPQTPFVTTAADYWLNVSQ